MFRERWAQAMKLIASFAILSAAFAAGAAAAPVAPSIDPFAAEIAKFERGNIGLQATSTGTLFIGSSSVRLWTQVDEFPVNNAINRGFGGATTTDVLRHYPALIGKFRPSSIIVYVGENDIAAGREPEAVTSKVLTLLDKLRADFPGVHIAYLSIKPSPARWRLWPKMEAANAMIKARSSGGEKFDFLDVGTTLLAKTGDPEKTCFGPDGLHMSSVGYDRWNALVTSYLRSVEEASLLTQEHPLAF